jgi:aryl-alcohol dehydrogenase-like predicted oxidoreductase
MTFGRESSGRQHPDAELLRRVRRQLHRYRRRVFPWVSEEILGRWLQGKHRDDLVIATKVRFSMGPGPNDLGLSRKHILSAVEASLRRLNTDYLDLYQVHMWDPGTPLEETLDALHQLVRSGKVRYVGASNYAGYQLQRRSISAANWRRSLFLPAAAQSARPLLRVGTAARL